LLVPDSKIMDRFLQRRPAPKSHPNGSPSKGKERELREPPVKRVRREIADSEGDSDGSLSDRNPPEPRPKSLSIQREETADISTSVYQDACFESGLESTAGRPTAIESSLPEVKPEKDAIEEYEAFRASQGEGSEGVASRFVKREWVKGKSSLYVDAFNLALGTVLEDESHLFDEKERALFNCWDKLSYEAQYL
jgi:Fanconi-associated nuclease 1